MPPLRRSSEVPALKRSIIIDTDPGQDDAVAVLMAMGAPQLHVAGVIAVAGNAELLHTFENARRLVEFADPHNVLGLRVYRGSDGPIARALQTCNGFHGKNGIGDLELPPSRWPAPEISGVEFLAGLLARTEAPLTVCMLGPLTDLGRVLANNPSLAANIEELVFMGGAYGPHGNITPAAEFNMHVDPEAAKIVIDTLSAAGVPITMIPLDVTHKAVADTAVIDEMRSVGTASARLAADILNVWGDKPHYIPLGGKPLHDPCVIAYLLQPALFSGKRVNVEIETQGQWTSGMTVVDWWGETARKANVQLMTDIDRAGYFKLIGQCLGNLA